MIPLEIREPPPMQLHDLAQPQLPDLAGQPPWVVIVVSLLFAVAWVGTRWVARGRDAADDGEENESPTRPLPPEGVASALAGPSDHESTAAVLRALELLRQEAEESREERGEATRWRQRAEEAERLLAECVRQLPTQEGRHER